MSADGAVFVSYSTLGKVARVVDKATSACAPTTTEGVPELATNAELLIPAGLVVADRRRTQYLRRWDSAAAVERRQCTTTRDLGRFIYGNLSDGYMTTRATLSG
jgi:hypothetical protein